MEPVTENSRNSQPVMNGRIEDMRDGLPYQSGGVSGQNESQTVVPTSAQPPRQAFPQPPYGPPARPDAPVLRRVDSRSFFPAPPQQRPANTPNFQPQNWPRPPPGGYRPPGGQYRPQAKREDEVNYNYETQQNPFSSNQDTDRRKSVSFNPNLNKTQTGQPLQPRQAPPSIIRRPSPWALLKEKLPTEGRGQFISVGPRLPFDFRKMDQSHIHKSDESPPVGNNSPGMSPQNMMYNGRPGAMPPGMINKPLMQPRSPAQENRESPIPFQNMQGGQRMMGPERKVPPELVRTDSSRNLGPSLNNPRMTPGPPRSPKPPGDDNDDVITTPDRRTPPGPMRPPSGGRTGEPIPDMSRTYTKIPSDLKTVPERNPKFPVGMMRPESRLSNESRSPINMENRSEIKSGVSSRPASGESHVVRPLSSDGRPVSDDLSGRPPSSDMSGNRPKSGDLSGSRPISGDLTGSRPISGDLTGSRPISGDLSGSRPISGDLSGSRPISGDLSGSRPISVDSSGNRQITGALPGSRPISGDVLEHNSESQGRRSSNRIPLNSESVTRPPTNEMRKSSLSSSDTPLHSPKPDIADDRALSRQSSLSSQIGEEINKSRQSVVASPIDKQTTAESGKATPRMTPQPDSIVEHKTSESQPGSDQTLSTLETSAAGENESKAEEQADEGSGKIERPKSLKRTPSRKGTPDVLASNTDSDGRTTPSGNLSRNSSASKTTDDRSDSRLSLQRRISVKRPKSGSKTPDGDHDSGVDETTQGKDVPTTNGDLDSPNKSPSKIPAPKRLSMPSPTKSTKSSPKTPETPSTADKKKVPMNKVQVGAAPSPNLKTVRSKIGSLDNTSYKPGGGKIKIENRKVDFSHAQPRIAAKNDTYSPGGGDKKITQVKLAWNAKSKIGSLDNAAHKPGGGDKKIESMKLDFKDKAKPKIGSKDNIKHQPGGGAVKSSDVGTQDGNPGEIEEHRLEIKAESKVGSMDNVKHKPGGGEKKIFDDKEYIKQMSSATSKAGSEGVASGTQSPLHMSRSQELSAEVS